MRHAADQADERVCGVCTHSTSSRCWALWTGVGNMREERGRWRRRSDVFKHRAHRVRRSHHLHIDPFWSLWSKVERRGRGAWRGRHRISRDGGGLGDGEHVRRGAVGTAGQGAHSGEGSSRDPSFATRGSDTMTSDVDCLMGSGS